ncbi:oxidoreductase [Acidocella sp. KAb 2-4]|uniref:oxidoreductase n=1 Tax=Acidocella sp. KAb 2-4 TaxID=2885158 RepID=UPI001D062F23|nr:oxidoreductase [Acidocella sp. KAb 2-4]MCB5943414.1 SDR family oxidoreductase [Acidocella sp. KAb 2-4]
MALWPGALLPDLSGLVAVVTGANSGIGYYTALELARAGADTVLACRNAEKGEAAAARINAETPGRARFMALDLADLASVRRFAAGFGGRLDLLINNAGVMKPPRRRLTAQGFELQFGVNFLGHFLLTALLLPALRQAPSPRVVQVSSIAHRRGRMNFDDLHYERRYESWGAYQQSKLAILIFAQELQRRSDAAGWGLCSLAAHPGIASTALVANGPGRRSLTGLGFLLGKLCVVQSGEAGAWPLILAATDPAARPGGYYGPRGWGEYRGTPGLAKAEPKALDPQAGARLWQAAEAMTGAVFTPAR